MEFDLRQRSATLRVLYAGPERATKFLNVRRLQEGFSAAGDPMQVMHVDGGRVLALPVDLDSAPDDKARMRILAMATPGRMRSAAVHDLLVDTADAIVFLPARDDPGGAASRKAFKALVDRLAAAPDRSLPLIVQDYADGPSRLDDALLRSLPAKVGLERVVVAGDRNDAVNDVFLRVRERLLDRWAAVRSGSARRKLPAAPARAASSAPRRPDRAAALEAATASPSAEVSVWRDRLDRHYDLWLCLLAAVLGVGAALWVTYGG